MNFGEILEAMKKGLKVRRDCPALEHNRYVIFDKYFDLEYHPNGAFVIICDSGDLRSRSLFVPSSNDLLADDWKIVPNEQPKKSVYITTMNSMLEECPHIKLDDAEINPVSGQIKVCFMHTPRGVYIREPIQEDTVQQVKEIIHTANGAIKKMAVEDVIKWCIEEHEPVNLNGISIIFDPAVPTDTIIMNHATFLKFRIYHRHL